MSKIELAKTYSAKEVEDKIYQQWQDSGFFNPDNLKAKGRPFVISMPPPNVTGVLHLGHAFENALMDIEVRYQRMKGRKALLIPGTDHAAVATQARVEDNLKKQGIKNPRQELGREELLKRIREYAENSKATILSQIKKMGTSCDWSRLAYTFDEPRSKAVNKLFEMMYSHGLIYKGYRVVNWSVKGQSTCSDDELVYVNTKTKVYTFKYSKDFPIAIATTRPETKLGDTAVAVNPTDVRYKKYIGQKITVDVGAKKPLVITIVGDEAVDPKYGTGAVGVTPAHSAIDFEIYLKNEAIGLIQVIGPDGRMTENAGKNYQGLKIDEAREKFVSWLRDNNLFIKEEEIEHNVGTSDRFGDVVEALPMEQWFVDVTKEIPSRGKSLKDLMREAVTIGHNGDAKKKITIIPENYHDIYLHWIDNLRDWCISRQIWWGHPIPVWYCRGLDKGCCQKGCEKPIVSAVPPKKCPVCGSTDLVQDPDTLDTWFSSGAWTFSTLGWPEKTEDFKKFHPTTWMQMGYEILFFWMARMILMATYALDDIPFKDVYIHGIVRAKDGRKFSKSLGNGLDPIEMIEKYGTDALRFGLIKGVTTGNDSRFYEEKLEGARNFVNKLWNISRYILQTVADAKLIEKEPKAKTFADQWILLELRSVTALANQSLDSYEFSYAIERLYDFTWDYLADWYLEIVKVEGNKDEILLYVLQNILKLWHPFIPFVTEEIWKNLNTGKLLMVESYPQSKSGGEAKKNKEINDKVEIFKGLVTAIRNLRSENKIEPAKLVSITMIAGRKAKFIKDQAVIIKKLARCEKLDILDKGEKPKESVSAVIGDIEVYLSLSGLVDSAAEKERMGKEMAETEKYIKILESKLGNQDFVGRAPAAVVEKEKEKLATNKEKLAKLKQQLKNL